MKPDEIHLTDWQRIFIGEVPGFFFIELIFRSLFVYLLLIVAMRLMGKRMSAQIGRNEMAAVASLAAAVGIPLMNADRGLLPGLVIALVIIFFQVIISKRTAKKESFETLTQDELCILVKDGVLLLESMETTRISRERLFAQLRVMQQTNLGRVSRLYFEANGLFSLVEAPEEKPGLSLVPDFDPDFEQRMDTDHTKCVCKKCGYLAEISYKTDQTQCPECQAIDWAPAVISAKE